jgi:predicted permease
VLVAGQIALAMVLLIGAGLLLKTLGNLRNVDTGFAVRNVMTGSIALPSSQYQDPDRQFGFFHAVLDRLSNTPGIASAGAVSTAPFESGWGDPTASFSIEGRIVPPGDPGFHGSARYASPDYFKTLGIRLLAGRYFDETDRKNTQPVAVIDVNLAKRYWPGESPIGRRIRRGRAPWATIVGVVAHVKQASLSADPGRGTYYFSLYQQPRTQVSIVVRGNQSAGQLAQAIRNAVRHADPAQAVFDLKTMEQRITLALGPQQFALGTLMVFAGAALLLAAIGLYGVISHSVSRRTREIGIRTALGAERTSILRLILGQAMRLVAVGLAIGIVAATLLGRLIASQLFGVSPIDPATFVIAALALVMAALLASFFPAWRAARLEPTTALRNE